MLEEIAFCKFSIKWIGLEGDKNFDDMFEFYVWSVWYKQSYINRTLFDFVWYDRVILCLVMFTMCTTIGIIRHYCSTFVILCFYLLYHVRLSHTIQ